MNAEIIRVLTIIGRYEDGEISIEEMKEEIFPILKVNRLLLELGDALVSAKPGKAKVPGWAKVPGDALLFA